LFRVLVANAFRGVVVEMELGWAGEAGSWDKIPT
jgi:hypothetical protein